MRIIFNRSKKGGKKISVFNYYSTNGRIPIFDSVTQFMIELKINLQIDNRITNYGFLFVQFCITDFNFRYCLGT